MLVEIRCDEFISYGEKRPPITFHTGLNTVLGDETGSNSIGKSTFLMIVDFAFGGNDYVTRSLDVQKQLGPHSVQFAFEFNDRVYHFSRETINHTHVTRCDDNYNPISDLTIKSLKERLNALQEEQIGFLQSEINLKMNALNDHVYGGEKKQPVLTIKKPNSYTFLTPDDTGTGRSYKGLVLFDLSVLDLTPLPALGHDSIILKQIGDEPLEKIMELYSRGPKQVFIALDKKGSYLEKAQEILERTAIIHLSDGGNELFGRSWNVK